MRLAALSILILWTLSSSNAFLFEDAKTRRTKAFSQSSRLALARGPPKDSPPTDMTSSSPSVPFFLRDDRSQKEQSSPSHHSSSTSSSKITSLNEQQFKTALDAVDFTAVQNVVGPLFTGEVEKGVDPNVLKGVVVASTALVAVATKSIFVSAATGLVAAYVAITPGPVGDVVRLFGDVAWSTVMGAFNLSKKVDGEKVAQVSAKVATTSFKAVVEAAKKAQEAAKEAEIADYAARAITTQQEETVAAVIPSKLEEGGEISFDDWADAVRAAQKSVDGKLAGWDDIEKDLRELVGDQMSKQESVIDVSIPYDAAAKLAYEATDKSTSYDEFKTKYEEDAIALVKSKQAPKVQQEPEPELSIDVSLPYDAAAKLAYEASDKSLPYEQFKSTYEEEAIALVKSKKVAAETKLEPELSIDVSIPYDAAAKLAYEATDKSLPYEQFKVKYEEDAIALVESKQTQRLQREKENEIVSEVESMDDIAAAARAAVEAFEAQKTDSQEEDTNDIAAAARAAVEMFENGDSDSVYDDAKDWSAFTVAELKDELKSRGLPTTGTKDELVEMLEVDDDLFESEGDAEEDDLEQLAKAARAAVDLFDEASFDVDDQPSTDWASMTVKDLREELRIRGLPTTGKKADLILALEEAEGEAQVGYDDAGLEEFDVEELVAAREASELFGSEDLDEPTDEALWDIENKLALDYSSMTVAELKDELRDRGLPVSGNKAELIARLKEDEED